MEIGWRIKISQPKNYEKSSPLNRAKICFWAKCWDCSETLPLLSISPNLPYILDNSRNKQVLNRFPWEDSGNGEKRCFIVVYLWEQQKNRWKLLNRIQKSRRKINWPLSEYVVSIVHNRFPEFHENRFREIAQFRGYSRGYKICCKIISLIRSKYWNNG